MGSVPVPFGELLRRFRVAAGLSQEALAERAGVSARAVSDLERGVKTTPHRDTVQLLADALNLTGEERTTFESAVVRRRGPAAAMVSDRNSQGGVSVAQDPFTRTMGRPDEQNQTIGSMHQATTETSTEAITETTTEATIDSINNEPVRREHIVRERVVSERTVHEREIHNTLSQHTNAVTIGPGIGADRPDVVVSPMHDAGVLTQAGYNVAVLPPRHTGVEKFVLPGEGARAAPTKRRALVRRIRLGVGSTALLGLATVLLILLVVVPTVTCGNNPTMSAYWQIREGLCRNVKFQCLPSDPVSRSLSAVPQAQCFMHKPRLPGSCYFAATQHTLSGPFLAFWLQYGGLSTFGYPRTEPYRQDGVLVQYTDRFLMVRQDDGTVTTDNLGMRLAGEAVGKSISPFTSSTTHLYFAQTGHSLGGTGEVESAILAFWQSHHGPRLLGAPISEVMMQTNEDGSCRTYPVQWFERGRLEYHVEIVNPRYRVEVGLLGRQDLQRQGWLP